MFPLADPYVNSIMGFEGFAPKATWDYHQWTNGYGTKAAFPGEVIDKPTAMQRFQTELGNAASSVDKFASNLPDGVRAALTSLTYNAGPGWQNSGLGAAIKAGDFNAAKQHFLQYANAGGEPNSGLASRRAQEAAWFDGQLPANAKPTSYEGGNMNPLMALLSGGGDNTPVGSGILNGAFNQNPWNIADGLSGLGAGLVIAGGSPYGGAAMMNSINAGRQQNMPKFTQIATDAMGQPQYGWVRPSDMAIFDLNGKRMNVNGAGGTGGNDMSSQSGLDNLANKVAEVYRQGGKPQDALQLVPAGVRNYVEALGTGTALPKDIGFRQRTMLMNLAKIVYPGTTDAMFDARTKWAQQLESGTPGSFGGQITSMNKIVDHAAHALDVLPTLEGVDTDFSAGKLNAAKEFGAQLQGNADFQKNKGAYNSFISGLAYEKSKLLSGGQPSQGEWQHDMDAMDPAKVGPTAAKAAIMSNLKLMLGQGKGIANQRNMAFPDKVTAEDLLQPQNKAFLKSIGITSEDMNQNSTLSPQKTAAPEGKTVSPSGQTWTDPKTGKTYHVINGKLYE